MYDEFYPHIDLCYLCVEMVRAPAIPTKIVNLDTENVVGCYNITLRIAYLLMQGEVEIRLPNGDVLAMIAMMTVQNSRICSDHLPMVRDRIRT